ncbi:TIGR02757 family protein [Maribacter sp. 2307ULW6-5]|uniref:TIGR02757 family protein n=1 Tax=Maribacter sp. 2307ULW6-5 TaxID=3386275 RepID=UPI0039BC6511
MKRSELREFLDEKVALYNNDQFLESDPVQIPHLFTKKEDMEVSGFLTATIAWGNRKSIIANAHRLMDLMHHSPHDFVRHHTENDLKGLEHFVHRTFNAEDLVYFVRSLKNIYEHHGGLEAVFTQNQTKTSLQPTIAHFKRIFFALPHPQRTTKHVSDPEKGSAAKRINMFLRWMVRSNAAGVDLGLWKGIPPAKLSCPLDVHSGNVARKLKLLKRKQNDAKAVAALDAQLRKLDPQDPVKYDYALFGLGVFEKF